MSGQVQSQKKYPACEFFLDFIRAEYDNENQRKQTIDTKAGVLLALASALIPLIISQFSELSAASAAAVCLLVLAVISGFLALIFLIISVWSYKYDRLDSSIMIKEPLQMMQPEDAARAMSNAIARKTAFNRKKNNIKARFYMAGAVLLVVSLALFSVSLVAKSVNENSEEEYAMATQHPTDQGSPTSQAPQVTKPATVDEATALLNTPCYETSELHTPAAAPTVPVSPAPSAIPSSPPQKEGSTAN